MSESGHESCLWELVVAGRGRWRSVLVLCEWLVVAHVGGARGRARSGVAEQWSDHFSSFVLECGALEFY